MSYEFSSAIVWIDFVMSRSFGGNILISAFLDKPISIYERKKVNGKCDIDNRSLNLKQPSLGKLYE